MTTLAEFMIISGGENRPPMLEKPLYDSWKSKMELYMQNREHGRMILESVKHGPLIWPTIEENGQPSDVYSLVNQHRVSKDLWEKVQLLMQGEGHMARWYLKPKRKRDVTWFRDKVLLLEVQGSGKVLNEEELAFLADLGVAEAKAVIMANLSSYRSDVLSEVPHSGNTHNDMINHSAQEMPYSEQTHRVNYSENEITGDSNIIPYSQYLLETQNAAVQDINSSTKQDAMILSVFEQLSNQVTNYNKVNKDNLIANKSLFGELERYKERMKLLDERQNVDLSTREKLIMDDIIPEKNAQFTDFEKEIDSLKQTLYEQLKEKETLKITFNIRPMLYDGSVIAKETNVISIADLEETLMLEEESRSKMLLKQSDPMVLEKKFNIKPINYAELNRLSKNFGKRFVPQQELSDEQPFWLQTSHPNTDQSLTKWEWGFEHFKAIFLK
ncbi:hypothetical protein Tco_0981341 [Tanacetum coccineum]